MTEGHERKIFLFLISVFTVILLLLLWSFYFQSTAFFPAGTRPQIAEEEQIKPTMPPLRDTDPARGSAEADAITIVEFADFTCVYCRAVESELVKVLQENPDVRHVWRDMPIASETPEAMIAAVAGRCAKDQGKFWDMHHLLIQSNLITLDAVKEYARQIQLNQTQFTTCMSSSDHVTAIQSDIRAAREHNLTSAPTLFIGNEVISGFANASEIRWAVTRAKWSR